MALETNNSASSAGCAKTARGCAIITALGCVALIAMLIYMGRMPAVRAMMECRSNMAEVGEALRRYSDVNQHYPADLETLKKEYLKDESVLRCPVDKSGSGEPSYVYHRPSPCDRGSFIVLECDRHILGRNFPPSKLKLRKDGNIEVEKPPMPTAKK